MDGIVSVVVPIYNVEKYLDRCILSIVNQTYTNLEIILVDDGSPDNCPQICDAWAAKDPRIKVVHKENAGLGMARNTGIDYATGEYLCFVDSDDYIEEAMIEECYSAAKQQAADIVCFGNDKLAANGNVIETRIPTTPKNVFDGEEIVEQFLPMALSHNIRTGENWNLSLSACFTMFSLKAINEMGWRFVSEREIISEDFYSVLKFYRYINRAVVINKVFYHYTTNPASLTQTYRKDRYEKIRYFYLKLQELGHDLGCFTVLEEGIVSTFLGLTMGSMKQLVASDQPFNVKYLMLKSIITDAAFQNAVHSYNFDGENLQKKLLYLLSRNRCVLLCYLVVFLRNLKD